MTFDEQYAKYENGELTRAEIVRWVQENMSGSARNRAITRINTESISDTLAESPAAVAPYGGGAVTLATQAAIAAGSNLGMAARQPEQTSGTAEQAVYDAYESGAEVTEAMMAAFEQENPTAAAAFLDVVAEESGAGGAAQATGEVPAGFENMTTAQALQAAAMEAIRQGFEDPTAGTFEQVPALLRAAQDATLLESGSVKLDDQTLITSDMLNHPDPLVRAQYEQAFLTRQHEIEEQSRIALNAYNLDEYTLGRQRALDMDATAIAQHNAELATVRERLARDEISIEQASTEIDRILSGQQESRARADLITSSQQAAAPYGTTGGKSSFTGADLGAGATATLRQLGHANPGQAEAIRFPGTITMDPARLMAEGDAALGVDRPLPEIPQISVSDADIPRAPRLSGTSSVPLPQLTGPKGVPTIQLTPELLARLFGAPAESPSPDAAAVQR